MLDYQFHYLDTLALRDGLLQVQNGLLYDVAAPSRSPYVSRNLTLAAPLLDTLRQYSATFVLPRALQLTNRARYITGFHADFNDGGPGNRWLNPGQSITITYPGSGRKVVWLIAYFSDGTAVQVRSSIYVKVSTVSYRSIPVTLANLGTVEAKVPFRGYDSSISLFGKGDVLGVLHHPATQGEYDAGQPYRLRRPVIVMDGFDPGDKSMLLRDVGKDTSVYNTLRNRGILTLLDDQHLQRDLIILNFPKSSRTATTGAIVPDVDGGADFIERNAFVLIELINQLKSRVAIDPTTGQPYKFAIIGPSMGGLISRYALAYMERQQYDRAPVPAGALPNYWDHNTSTWLSFDAPHQGAVVPMADQAYLEFFKNLSDGARGSYDTNLNSPAAKQMLVHHILANSTTPAGAPGFRDRFMRALNANGEPGSLGYPVHLRRVALANGRLDGVSDPGGSPCGTMFDMEVKFRTAFLVGLRVGSFISQFFQPWSQSAPSLIAACNARYAPAANTSCGVFTGVINYSMFSYNLGGGFNYTPIYNFTTVRSGSQGSYDLAPGGWNDSQAQLAREAEAGGRYSGGNGPEHYYKIVVTNVRPNHCFIPTVSALGYQYRTMSGYQNTGSLPNPYTVLRSRQLVCNDEIPFDDFYAPGMPNSKHVTVPGNGALAFLVRELTPSTPTPVLIAKPTEICAGGIAQTFAVREACNPAGRNQPATLYTWTVTSGAHFSNGLRTATGASVMLAGDAGVDTNVVVSVTATRPGAEASTPATARVYVFDYGGYSDFSLGATAISMSPAPDYTVCLHETVQYSVSLIGFAQSSIKWFVGTPGSEVHQASLDGRLTFSPALNGPSTYYSVYVTATNSCTGAINIKATPAHSRYNGQSSGALVIRIDNGYNCQPGRPAGGGGTIGSPSNQAVAAYPNPANTSLTIELPTGTSQTARATVQLYDGQGKLVRQQAAQSPRLTLPTADLLTGIYYLVLTDATGRSQRQHLEIKH